PPGLDWLQAGEPIPLASARTHISLLLAPHGVSPPITVIRLVAASYVANACARAPGGVPDGLISDQVGVPPVPLALVSTQTSLSPLPQGGVLSPPKTIRLFPAAS